MDPNGSVPPPPPPPSGETFIAPHLETPKKKAHPFLIVFLILFILFDIAVGTIILLTKNKNQTPTLLKTQESDTSTAIEDQNTSGINVKQEGVASLTAPKFQNKLIFEFGTGKENKLYTINPDGRNRTPLNVGIDISNKDVEIHASPNQQYITISENDSPFQTFLYALQDKKLQQLDLASVNAIFPSTTSAYFSGWSVDNKKILFFISGRDSTNTPRVSLVSYDLASQQAYPLINLEGTSLILPFYYNDTDQLLVYSKRKANQLESSNYTLYYRNLKTNDEKQITWDPKYYNSYGRNPRSIGLYFAGRAPGDNDEQKVEIFSINNPTTPILTISVPFNTKDGYIYSVMWSGDYHYFAILVRYRDRATKQYTRADSLHFYTFEGEEIMQVNLKNFNGSIKADGMHKIEHLYGGMFAANNKYFVLATYPDGFSPIFWRTYDLESRKIISEKFTNDKLSIFPLAWY